MPDLPTPLPPRQRVSDRDRELRLTVGELVVHLPCGQIRGPIGRVFAHCDCDVNLGVWQSCRCEDEPVRWAGCDMSRKYDLCVVCARGLAGGTTRWSWIGCPTCRSINRALSERAPISLPLGRHSIMNGVALRPGGVGDELERRINELADMSCDWVALDDWYDVEVRRLAGQREWCDNVLLRTWREQLPGSFEASVDAFSRLLRIDVRRLLGPVDRGRILSTPQGILNVREGSE